jgi:hypothetical protein
MCPVPDPFIVDIYPRILAATTAVCVYASADFVIYRILKV